MANIIKGDLEKMADPTDVSVWLSSIKSCSFEINGSNISNSDIIGFKELVISLCDITQTLQDNI